MSDAAALAAAAAHDAGVAHAAAGIVGGGAGVPVQGPPPPNAPAKTAGGKPKSQVKERVPCPTVPMLNKEYQERFSSFMSAAFGRLFALRGAVRRARRARNESEKLEPKISFGDAPAYVKGDKAAYDEWLACLSNATKAAKTAQMKKCKETVENAHAAISAFTEAFKENLTTLLTAILQQDTDPVTDGSFHEADLTAAMPRRAVMRNPSSTAEFLPYVPESLRQDGVLEKGPGGTPHWRSTSVHVPEPWYSVMDNDLYVTSAVDWCIKEMHTRIDDCHFKESWGTRADALMAVTLEKSGLKAAPKAPKPPVEQSMAFKVAEALTGKAPKGTRKEGKSPAATEKGRRAKSPGGSNKTKKGKGKKAPPAPTGTEHDSDSASDDEPAPPMAGAGSGHSAPKGRSPRKAGAGKHRRDSSSVRTKSPHPPSTTRKTRSQTKKADGETNADGSTKGKKGGGSVRGRSRSAKPKGSAGRV